MNSTQRVFRYGAVLFAALGLVPGYYAIHLRWMPGADFDVTGFLWLLQNIPRLTAIVLTTICLGTAASFYLRSLR